jgi:hypothetical protein
MDRRDFIKNTICGVVGVGCAGGVIAETARLEKKRKGALQKLPDAPRPELLWFEQPGFARECEKEIDHFNTIIQFYVKDGSDHAAASIPVRCVFIREVKSPKNYYLNNGLPGFQKHVWEARDVGATSRFMSTGKNNCGYTFWREHRKCGGYDFDLEQRRLWFLKFCKSVIEHVKECWRNGEG